MVMETFGTALLLKVMRKAIEIQIDGERKRISLPAQYPSSSLKKWVGKQVMVSLAGAMLVDIELLMDSN